MHGMRAAECGIPIFLNARSDVFFQPQKHSNERSSLEEVIERTKAYEQARANGLFVPGLCAGYGAFIANGKGVEGNGLFDRLNPITHRNVGRRLDLQMITKQASPDPA